MSNLLPQTEAERCQSQPDAKPEIVSYPSRSADLGAGLAVTRALDGAAAHTRAFSPLVGADFKLGAETSARAVLIGGAPFGEAIVVWWNFVARSADEIRAARDDREAHRRFGDVAAYRGERLKAPAFVARPVASR